MVVGRPIHAGFGRVRREGPGWVRVDDAVELRPERLGCRDYAHADIRVRDGCPYLLEINPACDLSEGMGFARQARGAGYAYPEAVERIACFAAERMNVRPDNGAQHAKQPGA